MSGTRGVVNGAGCKERRSAGGCAGTSSVFIEEFVIIPVEAINSERYILNVLFVNVQLVSRILSRLLQD